MKVRLTIDDVDDGKTIRHVDMMQTVTVLSVEQLTDWAAEGMFALSGAVMAEKFPEDDETKSKPAPPKYKVTLIAVNSSDVAVGVATLQLASGMSLADATDAFYSIADGPLIIKEDLTSAEAVKLRGLFENSGMTAEID